MSTASVVQNNKYKWWHFYIYRGIKKYFGVVEGESQYWLPTNTRWTFDKTYQFNMRTCPSLTQPLASPPGFTEDEISGPFLRAKNTHFISKCFEYWCQFWQSPCPSVSKTRTISNSSLAPSLSYLLLEETHTSFLRDWMAVSSLMIVKWIVQWHMHLLCCT